MAVKTAYNTISISVEDHCAFVMLRRPPVNALNREMVRELTAVAKSFKTNRSVWVIAVTAEGNVFSAGADLKERSHVSDKEVAHVVKNIQSMVAAWVALPQPVIVGIQGAALGGGLELALAGDIIAASDSAILGFPETGLGIIPAAGGTQLLAHRTSLGIALHWILSAKRFTASQAHDDHIVDAVFSASTFDVEFRLLAKQVRAQAPLALREAKEAVRRSFLASLKRDFEFESKCYKTLIPTRDRKEALKAFHEKRTPKWSGK